MDRHSRVIIIASAYNHEAFVREAMDSLIAQTYEYWELYVANDGSTDRTGEILSEYADRDSRIHFYNFTKNTKLAGTYRYLERLAAVAQGDYICPMFSTDDTWYPDKLAREVAVLDEHPEYACCYTWDDVILENPNDLYVGKAEYSHIANQSREAWLLRWALGGNTVNSGSALVRKDVWQALGGFDASYLYLHDFRLWLLIAARYPFYVIEEPLLTYRRHQGNSSTDGDEGNFISSRYDYYGVARELFSSMDELTFKTAFYPILASTAFANESEYRAAQFIMLESSGNAMYEQAAMDIYHAHSRDELFIGYLEQLYGFDSTNFASFTQSGGLLRLPTDRKVRNEDLRHPCDALLLSMSEDCGPDTEALTRLNYSTLISLSNFTPQQDWDTYNLRVAQARAGYLDGKKSHTVVFLIGEGSHFVIKKELARELRDDSLIKYIAEVPLHRHMYDLAHPYVEHRYEIDSVTGISVYDGTEHRLRFLWEMGIEADEIYYIDCLSAEYDCASMIAGYPLSTRNICIMKEHCYQALTRDNPITALLTDMAATY